MAKLDDLVEAISDAELKAKLKEEIAFLKDRTDFGLVYERHLPETVIVGDIDPLDVGDHVRPKKSAHVNEDYRVIGINGKNARLLSLKTGEERDIAIAELLAVKRFGDPAYVGLEPLGSIRRSKTRPSHAVINGENFHAVQLLALLYEHQVDCIYIDPPYNTGAKDWTYNNDYVDANDSYRHSKWLSMMEKRLRIAKRLLKRDGALIVTIDWREVHHLGMLLEELFPEYDRQMITCVINPSGQPSAGLNRVDEHIYVITPSGMLWGADQTDDLMLPEPEESAVAGKPVKWENLLRRGTGATRADRQDMFYPIWVHPKSLRVMAVGDPLPIEQKEPDTSPSPEGWLPAYPFRSDGSQGRWRVGTPHARSLKEHGFLSVGSYNEKRKSFSIRYLQKKTLLQIEGRAAEVAGYDPETGVADVRFVELHRVRPKNVWYRSRHNASEHGTNLLTAFLGSRAFSYPKSLYSVADTLRLLVGRKPDALILDFFAGSGTTLHATCLLNQEDVGNRRSILITNNEVETKRAEKLNKAGHYRSDPEFEKHGVFEAATRPRCEGAIAGKRADGTVVEGSYLDGRPYADGFDENVEFFRLDYLDGDRVDLGLEFDAIHPMLWLASGARGVRPKRKRGQKFLISPECGYAVLFDDSAFTDFAAAVVDQPEITHVFLITDSEEAYAEMREKLGHKRKTMLLYSDFLRHYRKKARL